MKFEKDRFDDQPPALRRTGAHRAPRTLLSKLSSWLIALVAVAVLVGIGVGVMTLIDRQVSYTDDQATAAATTAPAETTEAPQPTATRNGDTPVRVLNGTGASGLASAGSERLTSAGWNVTEVGDADTSEEPTTKVVIASDAEMGLAMGVVADLGFGAVSVDANQASAGQVVVILGSDSETPLIDGE